MTLMRYLATLLAAALLLTAPTGCSRRGASEKAQADIERAQACLADGDHSEAKRLCDRLTAPSSPDSLSAVQLGRLSILYMQLSECSDMEDNTALAFQCFRNAFKTDRDSAAAYFASIDGEDARYVQLLQTLTQMLDSPDRGNVEESDFFEPLDSV